MATPMESPSTSPTTSRVVVYTPSPHKLLSPLSLSHRPRRRAIHPSPEKAILAGTTVVVSPRKRAVSATAEGSPTKKIKVSGTTTLIQDTAFNTVLGVTDPAREKALRSSKNVELSFSLFRNGRAEGAPNKEAWQEIFGLYEGTFSAEVSPPYLIIRLKEVPPKPWPLTIGGIPVWFTSHKTAMPLDYGKLGGGKSVLNELDLRATLTVNTVQLNMVASYLIDAIGAIYDLYWWAGFWTVTVADDAIIKNLPMRIGLSPAFYKRQQDIKKQDPAALRKKTPAGVERDDASYDIGVDAELRPGIMLSSSYQSAGVTVGQENPYLSTTSGILVVDKHGQQFITVASHGFGDDNEIWHPTPHDGRKIGKIVERLSDTNIAIAELIPGTTYTNTSFHTENGPEASFTAFSSGREPDVKNFDLVFMDNPYNGRTEGVMLATGITIPDVSSRLFISHRWVVFQNGEEPMDGACGSAIWDENDRIVGFFRFKEIDSDRCFSISPDCLPDHGYNILEGSHIFT